MARGKQLTAHKATSVTVRFEHETIRQLKQTAARRHVAVSFLVREAVQAYVDAQTAQAVQA